MPNPSVKWSYIAINLIFPTAGGKQTDATIPAQHASARGWRLLAGSLLSLPSRVYAALPARPPRTKATRVAFAIPSAGEDQLRVWSTSLFLAIQGIMARNWAPTTSIWCSAVRRRRAVMLG